MACAKFDELHQKMVEAMIAEDRTHDTHFSRGMSSKNLVDARSTAKFRLGMADLAVNRHIDECETCKADGQKHVQNTFGQL